MAITFRIAPYSAKLKFEVMEVLMDGKPVAAICPFGENGVKLISPYARHQIEAGFADRVIEDDGSFTWPPISALLVSFDLAARPDSEEQDPPEPSG